MMKKSLIIIGTFLYISILINGLPFQINTNPSGNNSNFSLDTTNLFVYAQVDGDKGESSGDKSNVDSTDGSKEKTENSTPDFSNRQDDNTEGESSFSSNEPSGISKELLDNEPPIAGGDDEPPIAGGDNTQNSKHNNDIKEKVNFEFETITKIISKTKNKVIVEDDRNNEKEIIIVSDPTCPTQSENVELNGIINPKSIRLLANFYPCTIENGGLIMNIPESPHLKMAIIYIDNNSDNHAGTLISPTKIQNIDKNQGLFSIELDKKITGNDPITGELTTLNKINGLALYNNGNAPLEFKAGSSVALTATFH